MPQLAGRRPAPKLNVHDDRLAGIEGRPDLLAGLVGQPGANPPAGTSSPSFTVAICSVRIPDRPVRWQPITAKL
jgi:hypothetical protein